MILLRAMAAVAALGFMSVVAAGCGSGLSLEDATIRCDADKIALGAFFNDAVSKNCTSCFQECGDECVRKSTSPISYACADTSATSTTSTGTTTAQ